MFTRRGEQRGEHFPNGTKFTPRGQVHSQGKTRVVQNWPLHANALGFTIT
jgi:hypothetical protein